MPMVMDIQLVILVCFSAVGLFYTGMSISAWIFTVIMIYVVQCTLFTEDKAPKLYHADTQLAEHVIENCKRLREPFRPPYWARNRHFQTILPVVLPKVDFQFKREFLELSDGGVVSLDYGITGVKNLRPNAPILFALPGLNGDSGSVTSICKKAVDRGYRPVVFNKRGLAGSHLTTPKMQSFGDPSDMREAILFLKKSNAESDIVAVGYSAGSGLLASYLGEYGASCDISAAVCNCPGYKLKELFYALSNPYEYIMLNGLKQMLKRHEAILSRVIDVDAALNSKRLIEFEEKVYCKIYRYKNMEEYYGHNEPGRGLEKSVPPVLCINSVDDPICIKELFPYDIFRQLPNAMLAETSEGGHCGFVERSTWNRWADDLALDYIKAAMDFDSKKKELK